jgi:rhodanese-related sulfurtransferase
MNQSMIEMMAEAKNTVPAISPGDAAQLLAAGSAIALDVRNDIELAQTGKVAGALHIPLNQVPARHASALDKNKTILLYCASGGRSALAGKFLHDNGYGDVRNLGGFSDWANSGGAVEPA